jgi:protein SCO1
MSGLPDGGPSGSGTGGLGGWRGFLLGGPLVVGIAVLLVFVLGARPAPGQTTPTVPPALQSYLLDTPVAAPALALTDATGQPFVLADHRDALQLVFFGYTHCPDVCPATLGVVGEAIEPFGERVQASMVTVDPERDTVELLRDYSRYLPAEVRLLTGSADQIRATADAWGVRYARVDRVEGPYSMSHTADLFLVDGAGMLRARFPFGTGSRDIERVLALLGAQAVVATARPATPTERPATPTERPATPTERPATPTERPAGPPSASPTPLASASASPQSPAPTAGPPVQVGDLRAAVVSSSVWAGEQSPVILALYDGARRIDDMAIEVTVQLHNGVHPIGGPVAARAVQPAGLTRVFYVATLDIPFAGDWQADVRTSAGDQRLAASIPLVALHPADTPPLGQPAPTFRTPTLSDVGGVRMAVTTDPNPDLRLSETSTADALAGGKPFVLVIDSWRFQVTPACGQALVMARYLLDRWPGVAFIHLEPYRYSVVTSAPVLDGTLDDPPLVEAAGAWGLGPEPWDARSVPWVFVVDGNGTLIAKYQGLVGTEDVDVILSMIRP